MSGKPNDPYDKGLICPNLTQAKQSCQKGSILSGKFPGKFRGQGLRPNLTDVLSAGFRI